MRNPLFIVFLFLAGCGASEAQHSSRHFERTTSINDGYYSVVIFANGGPSHATWWVGHFPTASTGDTPIRYAVNTKTDRTIPMAGVIPGINHELAFGEIVIPVRRGALRIETQAVDHNSFTGALLEYEDGRIVTRWVLFGSKRTPSCYSYEGDGSCREW